MPPIAAPGSGSGALSDRDFDSMLQALSNEAGMPPSNTAGTPPSHTPPAIPPSQPPATPQQPAPQQPMPQQPAPPAARQGIPTNQPLAEAARPAPAMEPTEMVAALESRGLQAILVSWPPAKPYAANMAFSVNLTREGANDMLLKIAFQIIKQRWPELGSMLTDYENQVN